MTGSSIEQTRRVVDHRAFDGEHFELCHDAAIGGKSAGFAAGGEHAMAGHNDRTRVAPECLADIARQLDAAEPLGDIAVSERLARRDAARDVVDAAVELANAVEIENDVGEVIRPAREQLHDPIDGASHFGRRRSLRNIAMALANAGAGLVLAPHRQLHRIDAARAPRDAAAADRGVEYCKMLVAHGWLRIPWLHGVYLTPGWNMGLEIVAIHPNSGGTRMHQQHAPHLWSFRDAQSASPESITRRGVWIPGLRPEAYPGMTVSPWARARFQGMIRSALLSRFPLVTPSRVPHADPSRRRIRHGLSRGRRRPAAGLRAWHAGRFPDLVGGGRTAVEKTPRDLAQPAALLSRTLGRRRRRLSDGAACRRRDRLYRETGRQTAGPDRAFARRAHLLSCRA